MTASFNDLKRNSSNSFSRLHEELNKINNQASRGRDERTWSCQTDKAGNGAAVIRFLPAPAGEDVPFIRLFTHGFRGPGGWYIENSLTTIGQQDPISELNTRLWNSGNEADKATVRKQKRQLNYYSNIYVIKDPANPENEGKVFLFRYGKKIFDKINNLLNPQFEGDDPIDPFNLWSGANFKLRIRQVECYANYDLSEFAPPGPLFDDDDKLEQIWKQEYSLQELISPSNFRSYDELKKRLERALGVASNSVPVDLPEASAPVQKATPPATVATDEVPWADDEDINFFKGLMDDDD